MCLNRRVILRLIWPRNYSCTRLMSKVRRLMSNKEEVTMPKPHILVADDEEGIRESLNLILGDDYQLSFAEDGEQTLTKLRAGRFDLVLLDIKMPKRDGLDVLREIKSTGLTTPVLVLTAYQSIELAREAVKLGALDYLPKPFEREQILGAVQDILAKR